MKTELEEVKVLWVKINLRQELIMSNKRKLAKDLLNIANGIGD